MVIVGDERKYIELKLNKYIYIYVCVCMCVYVRSGYLIGYILAQNLNLNPTRGVLKR